MTTRRLSARQEAFIIQKQRQEVHDRKRGIRCAKERQNRHTATAIMLMVAKCKTEKYFERLNNAGIALDLRRPDAAR